MLSILSRAIEARDPYTRGHSTRVTVLAEAVARRLGWSEEQIASLRVGGPLHDIGKLAVSDEVLCKEGRLDDDELAQIREHPKIGARILLRVTTLREAPLTLPGERRPGRAPRSERNPPRRAPRRTAGSQRATLSGRR